MEQHMGWVGRRPMLVDVQQTGSKCRSSQREKKGVQSRYKHFVLDKEMG